MLSINAYRSLGIMVALDTIYLEGVSERVIGAYYSSILSHLKDRTLFIAVDEERKPIGYAAWEVDKNQSSLVRILRQSAPFGNHLELQRQLEQYLPEGTRVISRNPRSARTEQAVW